MTKKDDNKMASTTKVGTTVEDKMNEFFTQNPKFFAAGDINGKRHFLHLELTPVGSWRALKSRLQKQALRPKHRQSL